MAGKSSGLGSEFYFCGYDVSGCTSAIDNLSSPRTTYDVTGLNKSSTERIYGRTDGCISVTSHFNPCNAHCVYTCLPTANVNSMVFLNGGAVGTDAAMLVAKQLNYDGTRGADGSLSFSVQAQANGTPLEWGTTLVAKTTICAAGNSPSVSNGLGFGTTRGVMVMLHVTDFCGCNLCVALQESSDDGCTDCFATIASFTQVTGANASERITTGSCGTVEEYLRLNYSGTFCSADVVAGYRLGVSTELFTYC